MATIIEHIKSGKRFVLLGAGYSTHHTSKAGFFGPITGTDGKAVVCASDADGEIGWIVADTVRVVTVDGETPTHILRPQDGQP